MTRSSAPLLSRRATLLGALGLGIAAADAWLLEPRWLAVERVDVPVAGLGAAWDGAIVVLLSDTHCGRFRSPEQIAHAVDLANAQGPDLVLLLGDYCHGGARHVAPGIAPFSRLRAREGVFAVLGNHDHWDGREASLAALRRAGVDSLENRGAVLRRRGDALAVGGAADLLTATPRADLALAGVAPDVPRILMEHNPDYAEQLPADVRVDLMVSGHTHGGQVWVPGVGAPILPTTTGQKYARGLVAGPRCPVYVTRGVGTISPPVRFACRPEVTRLRLVAREA
jgi:predicted MPP superfamily phosphohydrolase